MNIITGLFGGGVVAAVLLFVQFLINRHDTKNDKRDAVTASVNALAEKIDTLEDRLEQRDAVNARRAILRFGDELYNNIHHRKEMFDQILEESDAYDHYCDDHPDFKNSKTVGTVKFIRDTYAELFSEHKFM